jgi:hypothetical protein
MRARGASQVLTVPSIWWSVQIGVWGVCQRQRVLSGHEYGRSA